MTARWHFNPETGRTGRCDAKKRCKFAEGDVEPEHYPTAELAQQAYAARMQDSLVPTATKDAPVSTDARDLAFALYQDLPGDFTMTRDWEGSWVITGPESRLVIGDDEGGLTWTVYRYPLEDGGVYGYDYYETDGTDTTDWDEGEVRTFVANMVASLTK